MLIQTQPRPQSLLVLYNCGQLVYPKDAGWLNAGERKKLWQDDYKI